MTKVATTIPKRPLRRGAPYSIPTGKERLLVWEKARGIWQQKKPDPIQELKKMRRELERKLPTL